QPRFEPVTAPLAAGTAVGTLEVRSSGNLVGTTPLVAACAVERAAPPSAGGVGRMGGWLLMGPAGTGLCGRMLTRRYGHTLTKTVRGGRNRFKAYLRGYYRRG